MSATRRYDRVDPPPLEATALALGMTPHGRRWGPCPACGEARFGRDDRAPVTFKFSGERETWSCWRGACGAHGDAFDLVSYALNHCTGPAAGSKFRDVLHWLREQRVLLEGAEPRPSDYTPSRPPRDQVLAALRACTPAHLSERPDVRAFLDRRGYRRPVPAGVLPADFRADWWASRNGRPWTSTWPLVVPAYNGHGQIVSIHGRYLGADSGPPKTIWPRGHDSRGLVFADPGAGRALLRREAAPARLVIVEGLTDFLWTAQHASSDLGVLGIASGFENALQLLALPDATKVYVGTDHGDKHGTGDRYAQSVVDLLAPHPVRRIPLHLVDQVA